MNTCFQAEHRELKTRSGLKQLRNKGRLPGIIFGVNTDNAMIHISKKEFQQWIKGGGAGVLDINLGDNETIPVLLEDVQRDPVSQEYIHADFLRVQKGEVMRMRLPITFTGTPKGTKLGGIVQTDSSFIEVQALPGHLPSSLTIDISDYEIGDTLQGGDVVLPEGVSLISSPNEFLVSVIAPRINAEDLEEEAAAEE